MRVTPLLVAAAVSVGVLTACGSDDGAPLAAPPAGSRVELNQNRTEIAAGRMTIKLVNDGGTAFTVTSARVRTPRLAQEVTWRAAGAADAVYLAPHSATDVPAGIPPPDCAVTTGSGGSATLDLVAADGGTVATGPVPATDPHDVVAALSASACRSAATARIARIEVGPLTTAGATARLELKFVPTGAPGMLTVRSISSTTLLSPVSGADAWPVDRAVDAASGPDEITLDVKPTRCDLHAIAEDKVGTVLRVVVEPEGSAAGEIQVVPDAALKGQLQQFVFAACDHA